MCISNASGLFAVIFQVSYFINSKVASYVVIGTVNNDDLNVGGYMTRMFK